MKNRKNGRTLKSYLKMIAMLSMTGLILTGCSKLPKDGTDAKMTHFDDLRGKGYCEVFLIGGDSITDDLQAVFYNTTDLNTQVNPDTSCPGSIWAKVDKEAIKKQYDVLGVFKNGPRGWVNDWVEIPVGKERDFNGLQARWFGEVQLPKGFGKGSVAYKPTTVARKSKMGFKAGQPVFIIESPDGMPWVMQAYSKIVDPTLDYNKLHALGTKLKLAEGWKFRVQVLDKDLEIQAVNGNAQIVQDDLENTYDACFETACSYKP